MRLFFAKTALALVVTAVAMIDEVCAEDLLSKGIELYKQRKYSKAIECFNKVVDDAEPRILMLEMPIPSDDDVYVSNKALVYIAKSRIALAKQESGSKKDNDIHIAHLALKIACSRYSNEACDILKNPFDSQGRGLAYNSKSSERKHKAKRNGESSKTARNAHRSEWATDGDEDRWTFDPSGKVEVSGINNGAGTWEISSTDHSYVQFNIVLNQNTGRVLYCNGTGSIGQHRKVSDNNSYRNHLVIDMPCEGKTREHLFLVLLVPRNGPLALPFKN